MILEAGDDESQIPWHFLHHVLLFKDWSLSYICEHTIVKISSLDSALTEVVRLSEQGNGHIYSL